MKIKDKQIEFKTRIFHDGKVFLKITDAAKALGYSKKQDFINDHLHRIEKISGIQCISETDYNDLLSVNEVALSKQGQLEITRVETLRNKTNNVMNLQPLKLLIGNDYLKMKAEEVGCKSIEDYILLHEIPQEKRKALKELIENDNRLSSYQDMVDYLFSRKNFDIDKIRGFGLDIQCLTTIEDNGHLSLNAFVVGDGVFHEITNYGDYELWDDMYIDENRDLILPWCCYDSEEPKERKINLSQVGIKRNFATYNVIENMLWCIENLKVGVLEDYRYAVFYYYGDTIDFSMPAELLLKLLKPELVNTIYVNGIIEFEKDLYITDFEENTVFYGGYPESF